ncbi:Paternally-expressed 3 protein [Cucumispora dikerogammari]|nr:Paternally-expressed 3 protein [Cucumispora dikerogammari]
MSDNKNIWSSTGPLCPRLQKMIDEEEAQMLSAGMFIKDINGNSIPNPNYMPPIKQPAAVTSIQSQQQTASVSQKPKQSTFDSWLNSLPDDVDNKDKPFVSFKDLPQEEVISSQQQQQVKPQSSFQQQQPVSSFQQQQSTSSFRQQPPQSSFQQQPSSSFQQQPQSSFQQQPQSSFQQQPSSSFQQQPQSSFQQQPQSSFQQQPSQSSFQQQPQSSFQQQPSSSFQQQPQSSFQQQQPQSSFQTQPTNTNFQSSINQQMGNNQPNPHSSFTNTPTSNYGESLSNNIITSTTKYKNLPVDLQQRLTNLYTRIKTPSQINKISKPVYPIIEDNELFYLENTHLNIRSIFQKLMESEGEDYNIFLENLYEEINVFNKEVGNTEFISNLILVVNNLIKRVI